MNEDFQASVSEFSPGLAATLSHPMGEGMRARPRFQQEERFHIDLPAAENLPFLRQRIGRDPHAVLQVTEGFIAQVATQPFALGVLQNFIYCLRLFNFKWVENIFQENPDTAAGSHVHRNVDAPSRLEDPKELGLPEGAKIRSLRLESESLGLIGVVDIVEGGPDDTEIIDYKKGSARRGAEGEREAKEPDAVQVAAHALLLREQGVKVARGAIYYAADKRSVPVAFSEELFAKVRSTIEEARAVAASSRCPSPLKNDARCLYCSAYLVCLPNETLWWSKRRKPAEIDGQIQFGFIGQTEDAVRDRILEALDFAAESGKGPPTLEPPRPEHDDGEVLVVQTPGAQIGQRGDQLVVSVKGEEARKIPGQQVRAIYCYGAVQITAQAVATCLDMGIDVCPAGRFIGLLRGLERHAP